MWWRGARAGGSGAALWDSRAAVAGRAGRRPASLLHQGLGSKITQLQLLPIYLIVVPGEPQVIYLPQWQPKV